MKVGQANCDIHNFGHYLVKLLDTNSLFWDKLITIGPDYGLLNDHNENYFINKDKLNNDDEINLESNAYGRKLNIRGKNIILIYNDKIDAEYLNDNPFSVAINRNSDSIHTLLINFNAFIKMVAEKDYNAIFSFFMTFFKWLYGDETPQSILHALLTYIDVVYHNLNMEKASTFIDFNIAESSDIISQILMSKFHIPNPHGFVSKTLDIMREDSTDIFAELYYYPSMSAKILTAGSEQEFNLKGFIATVEEAFANQSSETKELVNALLDMKSFNDVETNVDKKYTKCAFKKVIDFEPRLEPQIDLLFSMSNSDILTAMDIIYKCIDNSIEKFGVKEISKEELTSDIEAQVRQALKDHNINIE